MIIRTRSHPVHPSEWGGRLNPVVVKRAEALVLAQLAAAPRQGVGTTTVLWETREAGPLHAVGSGARHGFVPDQPIPVRTIEWSVSAFWTPVSGS